MRIEVAAEQARDLAQKVAALAAEPIHALPAAIDWAGYLSVIAPTSTDLGTAIRAVVNAGLALFAPGAPAASGPWAWRQTFAAAAIARDDTALALLCGTQVDSLRLGLDARDESLYHAIEALQAVTRRAPDAERRLSVALALTDPCRVKLEFDVCVQLVKPELELWRALARRDAPAFGAALRSALEWHSVFWRKGDRRLAPEGFLAWGVLAAAAQGQRAGLPIVALSDYLPPRLVRGAL